MKNRHSHHVCDHSPGVSSFFAGALVGFVAGILTAPQPGKETRKQVKKTYTEYSKKAQPYIDELQEHLNPLIEKVKEHGPEAKAAFIEKVHDIVEELEDSKIVNKGLKQAGDWKKKLVK